MQMFRRFLAKLPMIAFGLSCLTCWLVLVAAVLASPTSWQLIALLALVIATFSLALSVGSFVFILSKQLSTHGVQLLDLNRELASRPAAPEPDEPIIGSRGYASTPPFDSIEGDDEEAEMKRAQWASDVVDQLFNPTREKLNDGIN